MQETKNVVRYKGNPGVIERGKNGITTNDYFIYIQLMRSSMSQVSSAWFEFVSNFCLVFYMIDRPFEGNNNSFKVSLVFETAGFYTKLYLADGAVDALRIPQFYTWF